MTVFRDLPGAVYILENSTAQRVKVGMTINRVDLRLRDANDKWLEYKVTCQVCGARRLASLFTVAPRLVPKHVVSGVDCPGGDAPPLESEVALAKSHVEELKLRLGQVAGSDKGSVMRRMRALEKRIRLRTLHSRAVGKWRICTVYYTDRAEQVELLSHELLEEWLDRVAPFGEVFCCSAAEAREAVETALNQLELLHSAKRHDSDHGEYERQLSE